MRTPLVLSLLFLSTSLLSARPAAADEPSSPEVPAAEAKGTSDPPTAPPADGAEPAFVDRDGDGLQDGQEHRFRGRWKIQGGQGHRGGGDGTMGRHGGGGDGERGGERRQRGAP